MLSNQFTVLEQLAQAGAAPANVLWQLLQGVPLSSNGSPLAWPSFEQLSVGALLKTALQLPPAWGIPAATGGVLACGLLTDYLGERALLEDPQALLDANDVFWEPLLDANVLKTLAPELPAARGLPTEGIAALTGTSVSCEIVNETVSCYLWSREEGQLGHAEFISMRLATPLAQGDLRLRSFMLTSAGRNSRLRTQFIQEIALFLTELCPSGAVIHVASAPMEFPYPLTDTTAPELWLLAIDARERVWKSVERTNQTLSALRPTLSIQLYSQA